MIVNEIRVNDQTSLKMLNLDDTPVIFSAIIENRHFLRTWLPFVDSTKDESDIRAFVKSIVDDVEHRQEVFAIWHKNQFAGLLGLKEIDYLNRKLEIGYWQIEEMCGKGIMTQSVEALMVFCFDELEMNRVQIRCGVGNTKSSAIPKRLGFTLEGIERAGEKHPTRYIDLEVFSFLKKEWLEL